MNLIKYAIRTILIFTLFLIMFVVIQLPTLSETFWTNETSKNLNVFEHILLFGIMTVISSMCVIIFYNRINNQRIFDQPITPKNICIALAFSFGSQLIQFVLSFGGDSGNDSSIISAIKSPLCLITITTLIIISPLLEEILFQGVLQGGILKKFQPLLAIVITAGIFAFLHGYSISVETLELFVSGISYALVYALTKDIKMSFVAHAISNCIVLLLELLQ